MSGPYALSNKTFYLNCKPQDILTPNVLPNFSMKCRITVRSFQRFTNRARLRPWQ